MAPSVAAWFPDEPSKIRKSLSGKHCHEEKKAKKVCCDFQSHTFESRRKGTHVLVSPQKRRSIVGLLLSASLFIQYATSAIAIVQGHFVQLAKQFYISTENTKRKRAFFLDFLRKISIWNINRHTSSFSFFLELQKLRRHRFFSFLSCFSLLSLSVARDGRETVH